MSETATRISSDDLTVTTSARSKLSELVSGVEDPIEGIRIYATPGGCSGISFGMTFTDQLGDTDGILDCEDFKVIVDDGTMQHLRGVEIDFASRDGGESAFVFNNLQPVSSGGGCGTCGSSSGGGCS